MNATDSIVGYMKHKKIDELGFMKYCYFKKIISYILDYHHEYRIRKLFMKLFEMGYFTRRKMLKKSSYKYKFNPNPKKVDKSNITDNPDIDFVVSWD